MADYTVQAGDTLSKIAKAHGTMVSELAKQNGIKDVNKIEVGQELSLGKTTETVTNPQDESTIGLDSFEKQTTQEANTYSPLAYAAGGAMAYGVGQKVVPYMTDKAKTAYTNAKSGTTKAYTNMKATAKHNAKAVKSFVAQKAKHAAKSAELHYAFGKDAVKQGVQKGKTAVKNTAQSIAGKAKHVAKSAELHYAFGKDAVKQGVQKGKTAVKNTAQKAKTAALNVATKTKTMAGNAAHKAKIGGRYTRFIANTKVAPKLIKGASRYALLLTIAFEGGKCYQAFDKGGVKEGAKQAVKSVTSVSAGLAGAKIGTSLGSFAGPVGTVIGGVAGGILGYCLGDKLCS